MLVEWDKQIFRSWPCCSMRRGLPISTPNCSTLAIAMPGLREFQAGFRQALIGGGEAALGGLIRDDGIGQARGWTSIAITSSSP